MQGPRIFDDVARVAQGAVGAASGVRTEIEALVRQRMERHLDKMNLVSREEFDVVKEMAERARQENENLKQRLDDLEQRVQNL